MTFVNWQKPSSIGWLGALVSNKRFISKWSSQSLHLTVDSLVVSGGLFIQLYLMLLKTILLAFIEILLNFLKTRSPIIFKNITS